MVERCDVFHNKWNLHVNRSKNHEEAFKTKNKAGPIQSGTRTQTTFLWKASNRRCGRTGGGKAIHGETLQLNQLLRRIFCMAYSNTMAPVVPVELCARGWHRGPRARIHVCLQCGADTCPVFLKLTLSGILCFSTSAPCSLHTQCDSTRFP